MRRIPSSGQSGAQEAWCRAYAGALAAVNGGQMADADRLLDRRQADSRAAWLRWHPAGLEESFEPGERPWYLALERARVELRASRELPGVARNLWLAPEARISNSPIGALYLAAREILRGSDTVPLPMPDAWMAVKDSAPAGAWSRVMARIGLGPRARCDGETGVVAAEAAETVHRSLVNARSEVDDGQSFAAAVRASVQILASRYGAAAGAVPPSGLPDPSNISVAADPLESAAATREGAHGAVPTSDTAQANKSYRIFDPGLDLECSAGELFQAADAAGLQNLANPHRQRARRLAHRLQRRIETHRQRRWSFDQEEGLLDSRRLMRLVVSQSDRRVFRCEDDSQRPEASVALLVDQSGSMRGDRREMVAMAIDFAVHLLEVCRIECEVLGYTTRFGSDSPATQAWRNRGCPLHPGRLNSVQHVVYKSAEQQWSRVRRHLGVLLRPELGQENIDGEALLWAARRLCNKRPARRILIVLSDGAPFDTDTVAANGRLFLEDHLRESIADIERSGIVLSAIGASADVGRFYRKSITLRDPEKIAESLFNCLGDALCSHVAEVVTS